MSSPNQKEEPADKQKRGPVEGIVELNGDVVESIVGGAGKPDPDAKQDKHETDVRRYVHQQDVHRFDLARADHQQDVHRFDLARADHQQDVCERDRKLGKK